MRKSSFENRWTSKAELNLSELTDFQKKEIQRIRERRTDDTYYRGGRRE